MAQQKAVWSVVFVGLIGLNVLAFANRAEAWHRGGRFWGGSCGGYGGWSYRTCGSSGGYYHEHESGGGCCDTSVHNNNCGSYATIYSDRHSSDVYDSDSNRVIDNSRSYHDDRDVATRYEDRNMAPPMDSRDRDFNRSRTSSRDQQDADRNSRVADRSVDSGSSDRRSHQNGVSINEEKEAATSPTQNEKRDVEREAPASDKQGSSNEPGSPTVNPDSQQK